MQKRQILVDVTHTNLLEGTKDIKSNCKGTMLSNGFLVYQEDENTKVTVSLKEEALMILREGENQTRIDLNKAGKSSACMKTEFGDFIFDVETEMIESSSEEIVAQYALKQGNQLVNQVHIRWVIKGEQL